MDVGIRTYFFEEPSSVFLVAESMSVESSMKMPEAVLVDIDGVLHVGLVPVPGASKALRRLRSAGLKLKFLTNASRISREGLVSGLQGMGFEVCEDEVLTAGLAARALVERRKLRPHLLIHPGLLRDWQGILCEQPNAVVVGDAREGFSYAALNAAFRVLMDDGNTALIALGANRYYQASEGLQLDMGAFVAALEYAVRRKAEYTGKPSPSFFKTALQALNVSGVNAVMIGDDLENDIGAAQRVGLRGILVRTGKYRSRDETDRRIHANFVADDFAAAVDQVLSGGI